MADMKVKGLVYKKCAVDRVPSPSYVKTYLFLVEYLYIYIIQRISL